MSQGSEGFAAYGMNTANPALEVLRAQLVDIVLGTIFLSIGLTACAIALIRWRRGIRALVWLGIFSSLYGLQKLDQVPAVLAVLPISLESAMPYVSTAVMYLLLVSALFAWRELSLGKVRLLLQLAIFAGLAIALLGFGTFAFGGRYDQWMFYNNLLAVLTMLVLLTVVLVPKFSRFLVIANHRILTAATLFFALEVLYTNLSSVLQYRVLPLVDSLGSLPSCSRWDTWLWRPCLPTSAACWPSRRNWKPPGKYSFPFFRRAFPSLRISASPLLIFP